MNKITRGFFRYDHNEYACYIKRTRHMSYEEHFNRCKRKNKKIYKELRRYDKYDD